MTIVPAEMHQPATAEEAARMTASWPDLLHSQIQSQSQADQIAAAVHRLAIPATRQWIAGRVATLLSQYFASSIPAEMMTAIAGDWHEELHEYPSWALQRACRWWMSADNQDRRRKPLAGDIAARAKREMGVVKVAQGAVRRFNPSATSPQARPEPTAEQRAKGDEIVRAAGIALRGGAK